ncbi:MAG: nuclear transport factor 2 family protein [Chloroflexi bacterium]|nr:MAG: nuclear transport factor 2 family protein [Chloroflexota bacterium]
MAVYPSPVQPQSTGWTRWVLLGVAIIVLTIALCCGLFVFGGWRLFTGVMEETQAIQQVITQFMDAGRRNDTDAALALFADSAERVVSHNDLEQQFANRQLFREVSSVSLNSFNIKADLEGTTAEIAGQLNYVDGSTQAFSARLQKENDQWRLIRINFH